MVYFSSKICDGGNSKREMSKGKVAVKCLLNGQSCAWDNPIEKLLGYKQACVTQFYMKNNLCDTNYCTSQVIR